VLFEVMTPTLDRARWCRYRSSLAQRFAQDEVLVRTTAVDML